MLKRNEHVSPRVLWLLILIALASAPATSTAQSGPQWIGVTGPGGAQLRAAVFHPPGAGPFPLVAVFHGGFGLGDPILDWGRDLARAGFVAVVGCYFKGRNTMNMAGNNVNPCPNAPAFDQAGLLDNAVALIYAGQRSPDVRQDKVGLVGWSAGGAVVLDLASLGAKVQAVVAVAPASDYTGLRFPSPISLVDRLGTPLLLLHANGDTVVSAQKSRAYEAGARASGKIIETYYYDGGQHTIFIDPQFKPDLVRRSIAFFNQHLLH